jgi:hypothetical protein
VHYDDVVREELCAEMEDSVGLLVGSGEGCKQAALRINVNGSAHHTVDLAFDGHTTSKIER